MTLDEVELAGKIYGGDCATWASRILNGINLTMPRTTGVAYLDEESCIVGVSTEDGFVTGSITENVLTDLSRADACHALRAFDEGYRRVRPMIDLPTAIIHETLPPLAAAAEEEEGVGDLPEGAKVFAEVDSEDNTVVYDLWAVSASGGTEQTVGVGVWRRHAGDWVPDPGFFTVLKSSNTPALVYIDSGNQILGSVISQVDAATDGQTFEPLAASAHPIDATFFLDLMPLVAARRTRGGLKQAASVGKGGNAEQLREYWAHGEGATKIRWGVGGDFYRCVKHLRKYMGVRSKGYCNLIHKRALGYYPATHAKNIKDAKGKG